MKADKKANCLHTMKGQFLHTVFLALFLFTILSGCISQADLRPIIEQGNEIQIYSGETIRLTLETSFAPTDEETIFQSMDENIAQVTETGWLIANSPGKTQIRVWHAGRLGEIEVEVIQPIIAIENIWIGQAMYDDQGVLRYGRTDISDDRFLWIVEEVPNGQRIRNVASGNYISFVADDKNLKVLADSQDSENTIWNIQAGSISGGNTLATAINPHSFMHVEQKTGYVQCDSTVEPAWTSPQWSFIKPSLGESEEKIVIEGVEGVLNGEFDKNNAEFDINRDSIPAVPFWFFGDNMGGAGGKALVILDQGAVKVNILDPGAEIYAVQLIQSPIKVIQGSRYRVSFDARASEARSIALKIGGTAERGWMDYTSESGLGSTVQIDSEFRRYRSGICDGGRNRFPCPPGISTGGDFFFPDMDR